MPSLHDRLFDALVAVSNLPHQCPEDPELGAWFLSPQQHTVEFLVSSTAFSYLLYVTYRLYRSRSKSIALTKSTSKGRLYRESFAVTSASNLALTAVLTASLSLIFVHKVIKDRLWFMLQPCHVLHLLLLYICTMQPSRPSAIFLFNLYLHLLFSPLLGLVGADLTCYKMFGELENWFVQHVLLIVTPLIFIFTDRFPLLIGKNFFALSFSIEVLYHSMILSPISILTGYNLNYVLCPPSGSAILMNAGVWYRGVMIVLCAVLAAIVRYGAVEAYRWMIGHSRNLRDRGPDVYEIKMKGDGAQLTMEDAEVSDGDGNSSSVNSQPRQRRSKHAR